MPDQVVIDAGQKFVDANPILGSIIVIMMAVVIFLVWWIKALLRELAEAKSAHLADVKEYAGKSEAFRSVIEAHSETSRSLIEVVKERLRA